MRDLDSVRGGDAWLGYGACGSRLDITHGLSSSSRTARGGLRTAVAGVGYERSLTRPDVSERVRTAQVAENSPPGGRAQMPGGSHSRTAARSETSGLNDGAVRYSTIVADPPWHYDGFGVGRVPEGQENDGRKTPLPYPTMTVDEIAALPVGELAADDAHLYLWTTNRYLPDAFRVVEAWGFRYSTPLIWCKKPIGSFLGGAFTPSAEFVLFARRGKLPHTRAPRQWFEWPRQGQGNHSKKPEAFLDLVESVSPGPYLELFARRARFGWDYWGNESLGTAEVAVA